MFGECNSLSQKDYNKSYKKLLTEQNEHLKNIYPGGEIHHTLYGNYDDKFLNDLSKITSEHFKSNVKVEYLSKDINPNHDDLVVLYLGN